MAFSDTPNKYDHADARWLFFRSRSTLNLVFAIFFVLGCVLTWLGGTVLISVGTSLLAGAVVSLATLWIDQVRNGEQTRMEELAASGLIAAHQRRDLAEYDSLVACAKGIDVTGYTLKSFSEANEAHFKRRAAKGTHICARILLVDPACEAAKVMEKAEKLAQGQYSGSKDAPLSRLGGIEKTEIRLLSRHLPMMIYRIDDILYTGPYPSSSKSKTAFTLKLSAGWLFDRQQEDFDTLWKEAIPVTTVVTQAKENVFAEE